MISRTAIGAASAQREQEPSRPPSGDRAPGLQAAARLRRPRLPLPTNHKARHQPQLRHSWPLLPATRALEQQAGQRSPLGDKPEATDDRPRSNAGNRIQAQGTRRRS